MPSKAGNCDTMMSTAAPLVKPCSTGPEMKLINAPARSSPASTKNPATSSASVAAASIRSASPATPANAEATIKAATDTGPTAITRLPPRSAYASGGNTLAYSPACGGRPASAANASACGISTAAVSAPAIASDHASRRV